MYINADASTTGSILMSTMMHTVRMVADDNIRDAARDPFKASQLHRRQLCNSHLLGVGVVVVGVH